MRRRPFGSVCALLACAGLASAGAVEEALRSDAPPSESRSEPVRAKGPAATPAPATQAGPRVRTELKLWAANPALPGSRLTSGFLFVRPGRHVDRSIFDVTPPKPALEPKDTDVSAQAINVGLKIRY